MTDQADIVAIKLLGREYQIKCPPEKVSDLQEAANYLDLKMRAAMESGKIINHDRILMIAALNITNELMGLKRQKNFYIDTMNKRISDLQNKIDQALSE
jgi:cell division protein ZapA